jgi:hypothetical protein
MSEFWFKPKTYGYGATPVTWEGWAIVLAYVVVVGIGAVLFVLGEKSFSNGLTFFGVIALATAAMIAVSVKKTDGLWHWQWAPDSSRKAD